VGGAGDKTDGRATRRPPGNLPICASCGGRVASPFVETRTKAEACAGNERLKRLVDEGTTVSHTEARLRRCPTEKQLKTVERLAHEKGISVPGPRTVEEADRESSGFLRLRSLFPVLPWFLGEPPAATRSASGPEALLDEWREQRPGFSRVASNLRGPIPSKERECHWSLQRLARTPRGAVSVSRCG
jgi:hypothetical protein